MSRAFHGWRMVAAAFFVDFIAVGFFFYSYGVFFKALAADFGGARLDVALGLTLVNVVGGLLAPFIGEALDRFPIRRVITVGTLAMSLGFLLLSMVTAQWQFYLILATLIGFGSNAMGGLATAKLVANWFEARRGTALGIATMGISLSGVVMPIASALLIEQIGWRGGFLVFGAFTLVLVLPVVLAVVVSRPEEVGQQPDGRAPAVEAAPLPHRALPVRQLMRDRNFWVLNFAIGFLFCVMSATLTHMVPRVTDLGFSLIEAAPVLSFGAGAGVLGKVAFGWLVDRLDPRFALLAAIGSQFLGQIGMLGADGYALFAVGAAVFGFGMGGIVPLHGAIVGLAFGREQFGRVMGLMRPVMMPLQVAGLPFAGWVFDVQGSYDFAFRLFLAFYIASAGCTWLLRVERQDVPGPVRSVADAARSADDGAERSEAGAP